MAYDSYNKIENIIPISSIKFSVFGNKEIKKYSISNKDPFGINIPESYENNEPIRNGIVDSRLGTTDIHRDCDTCGLNSSECPGHFGHTELAEPVFHYGFIDNTKNILSCVCLKCSKLLLNDDLNEVKMILKNKFNKNRHNEIRKIASNMSFCPNCNAPVPKIKHETKPKSAIIQLIAEYPLVNNKNDDGTEQNTDVMSDLDYTKKKQRDILYADKVYEILRNISDTDCAVIGLDPEETRPENLIIKYFPIPPISIRPSVKADYLSSGTAEDDLTKKIADIIKQNLRIRKEKDKQIGEADIKITTSIQLLQYHIAVYFNNDSMRLPRSEQKSGGRPIKSISERLQGKQGRIRNNLEGKRTNFCARSVISSDPNIGVDELGVPIKIAMSLTFPEKVTPYNIEKLTKYVKNGRDIYPGANYVWACKTLSNGKKYPIDLRYRKTDIKLYYGDIVERHLINGDPILFNRQPSLHRPSMMCHFIKIIPNDTLSTFRLNVNVTKPYNADFDGDEMNMFIPQNIQTQMELAYIADVKKQIINPSNSNPIIEFKQDTPAGLYLLTETKKDLNWHEVMNMTMYLYDFDNFKIEKTNINTYQLFSYLIPEMINYTEYEENVKKLEIKNGELLYGKVNGNILTDKLITSIWDRYGPRKTKVFIDNAQRLAEVYLLQHGFTVGYKDSIPSVGFKTQIKELMEKKILEASHLLTEIENNPDLLDIDTFEKSLLSLLQTVKPDIGKMSYNNVDKTNNFYIMLDSKAKGKVDNLGAILAGKGQDILQFQRVNKSVNGRTLPHFTYNDDSAIGRGFIKNSYNDGLDPHEFWFYHQSGREGIINTAIKTAETGYQQRKMIKAMEDIMITYDGTVRTSNNIILQLLYGDNQLNQTMQKKIPLKVMAMGITKLKNKYLFDDKEIEELIKNKNINNEDRDNMNELNNNFYNKLKKMRDEMRELQLKARVVYSNLAEKYYQPVNYQRIINDIQNIYIIEEDTLSPFYIIEQIEYILDHDNTPLIYYSTKNVNSIKSENEKKYKFLFRLSLMEYLAPKQCINKYKLTKQKFDMIVKEIIELFNKTLIEPGEMVGIVSAQSMGEPLTQMTLSSFHKSGSGVAGLKGTPRIKELLGNTKKIATPIMFIYLKNEYKNDKLLVNKIASNLRYTIMKDIVKKIDIIYDPNDIYSEKDKIDIKSIFYTGKKTNTTSMPWLYRIYLTRESLLEYDITMLDIKYKFIQYWKNKFNDLTNVKKNIKEFINKVVNCSILTNFSNSETPIVHIRFELNNIDNKTLLELQDNIINKFNLKGTELITKIDEISHDNNLSFNNDEEELSSEKEYVIYTEGISYDKIRLIPYIDQNKTICNDVDTIYRLYGIEAARMTLIREIDSVFEGGINYHHISIVCDLMTNSGYITSIDRFGINRLDTDPLSKASFEKTIDVLINAAIFNDVDNMKSVSSRIMAGKVFKGGTGLCDIMIDNNILENSDIGDNNTNNLENTDYIDLTQLNIINDILNKTEIDDIYIPV
jgi:DNA-directed RNA polymerase II subunit RPB1